jgi:hypothetical protein
MALSYKAKKRLSLLILLVGLPVYIGLAWFLVSLFERPNMVIELGIYIGLGIVWAVPFKAVFRGIGQPDPAEGQNENEMAEGE